ncbi:hypothetical protein GB928_004560 [Shinella curvata]|uniref:Uncharacterized protein n=1 Tax=Shinella curvata TaxID=1817964 RepID=A0ABT8X9N9_9HYPH|nr:hypothetical protein [Shinella curvata]MCJ8055155.1 hypothetical protein [Shinella curvata]MDO6120449.1 hypothetical protein [Shinella curvata]
MRLLGTIAAFCAGMTLGIVLALGCYLAWVALGGKDMEGAAAMGAFFVYGPILGLIFGSGFSTFAWRYMSPGTQRDTPPGKENT